PHSQAPVGRKEPLTATQILRAGNFLPNLRDNPRNGGSRGWGSWRMRRSRIRLSPPPGAFLVTFWASKKSLAARTAPAGAFRSATARRAALSAEMAAKCPCKALNPLQLLNGLLDGVFR